MAPVIAEGIKVLAESNYWREQFQTISEHVSVRNVLTTDAFSALEVSRRCAIQIDFLLAYLNVVRK